MRWRWVGWVLLLWAASGTAQEASPPRPAEPPFWEARPYEEWTAAETLAVLTGSPWTRSGKLVEPGMETRTEKSQYYAQWVSAQTVREALVRLRHLYGRANPQGDAAYLGAARTAYQVFVFRAVFTQSGEFHVLPLVAFEGMTVEELQQSVRLVFSSQEHSSRPDAVEFVYDPQTQRLTGLRLTFERARTAVPPEQAVAGQVRLVCPTPRGSLSVSFLLEPMQRRGRPDL